MLAVFFGYFTTFFSLLAQDFVKFSYAKFGEGDHIVGVCYGQLNYYIKYVDFFVSRRQVRLLVVRFVFFCFAHGNIFL